MNRLEKCVLVFLALAVAFEAGRNESLRPLRSRKDSREYRQTTPRQPSSQKFIF